jgi:hypothetical protein
MRSQAVKVKYPSQGLSTAANDRALQSKRNSASRRSLSSLFLVAAFAASFIAAYFIVVALGSLFSDPHSQKSVASLITTQVTRGGSFEDAISVNAPGPVVRIKNIRELNPTPGGDFLLTVWVNVSALIADGERSVFLTKFDTNSPSKPGYAIALNGGPDGVRPQVHWQDEVGRGRWLTFAPVQLNPREWFLLGLSFREGRYVGLHARPLEEDGRVEVLGGYDLQDMATPKSRADLLLGSLGVGQFKGMIGPVGVFQGKSVTSDVPKILTRMVASPGLPPDVIESQDVVLWASPKVDSGPHRVSVTLVESKKASRP